MNISQPVSSALAGVDFTFLTSEDIQKLSVKRITNPVAIDPVLLNFVPGGLYDPALGSWEDNRCTTCNQDKHSCPGHCGHIELPVHLYHPMLLDQCLKLLKAQCIYCHHLRMSLADVDYYCAKLRLLRHGLLNEASEIDALGLGKNAGGSSRKKIEEDSDSEDEAETKIDKRRTFVKSAIKKAEHNDKRSGWSAQQTEAVSAARRRLLKEFYSDIGGARYKKCAHCQGISPSYRKDRFVKIFRKVLSEKDKSAMVMLGKKAADPTLVLVERQRKALEKISKKMDMDEAVADLDSGSGEDLGAEDDEDSDEDIEMVNGDASGAIIATEASMGTTRSTKKQDDDQETQEYMSSEQVRAAMQLLFEKEQDILGLVYGPRTRARSLKPLSPDMFFVKALLVSPNKFRPSDKTNGRVTEHKRNSQYSAVLKLCEEMNVATKRINDSEEEPARRQSAYTTLQNSWLQLQDAVNSLFDSTKSPATGAAARSVQPGIKQVLEKKQGLFRMNMMGKRVNYAARSVISPDPNIETNEIGVPPVFARKLTYPEPVTNHNFYELKQAVINGPLIWPGAAAVESEDGVVTSLLRMNSEQRLAVANSLLAPSNTNVTGARNKKVHRHLNNGDVVIMNRQPTLHKPSMMAHRARVLPGEKTIRMHYSNCNTYNADFDGDEMNMHFPQNEIARAEAIMIADTDHQYLSGTAGAPLRGLIQDHISISVWLCNKDTFFNRQDYQQLVYAALRPEDSHTSTGSIETVAPAILHPIPRWTGKQVITTVLLNLKPESHPGLTLHSRSQTKGTLWEFKKEESNVIFENGNFLCGVLDKKQIGPKHGGFVSAVYETYGHTVAGKLLSALGRLLTKLLHMRAFSCGVEDLILTEEGEKNRKEALSGAETVGLKVAAEYVSLSDNNPTSNDKELKTRLERVYRDDATSHGLDLKTNAQTKDLSSAVTTACLPDGLIKPFPRNFMQTMTQSGAKGSDVNANLISCNLGQQVLEGRRVPVMVSGKSLPCFKPFEPSIRAGGYVVDRFLTGIRPQEYFFHAMAGREGLIDTAVKTSRSGYLQRCLVKNMEGLRVEYDSSVRDSDGSMIQFLYGEDGLDVGKQTYLQDFKFLADNFFSMYESLNIREDFARIHSEEAVEATKAAHKRFRKTGDLGASDPGLSQYAPARYCGSTSEKFFAARREYIESNPDKLIKKKKTDPLGKVTKKNFEAALDVKYLKSVIEPGEAVGIIAGQSVGEPSTQMTLNTFHLAGHSAKNVTLGIPRLREIVMTASAKISTPAMVLWLRDGVTEEEGKKLAKNIDRLPLSAIIDKASVTEKLGKGVGHQEARIYKMHLDMYPQKEYCEEYEIGVRDVVSTIQETFIPLLQKRVRAELKKKTKEKSLKTAAGSDALPEIGESAGQIEQERPNTFRRRGDNDDSDVEDADDDADAAKARRNRDDEDDYDAPDQDELEIAAENEREESPEPDEHEDEAYGSGRESSATPSDASAEPDTYSDDDDAESSGHSSSDSDAPRRPYKHNAADFEEAVKSANADVSAVKFTPTSLDLTFEYNAATPKILLLPILEATCHAATIRATPHITSCVFSLEKVPDPNNPDSQIEQPTLVTDGDNLPAMWAHAHDGILDDSRLYTNSIASMLRWYGVEAARATIIRELDGVFSGHGIDVDNRHLNLIADTMTRDGGFKAFNRLGLATHTSPLAKMSFETTVAFLKDALTEEEGDDLRSPSSRIVVGRVGRVGTGGMDVLVPVA